LEHLPSWELGLEVARSS
jgi:hypothetical protein